VKLPVEPEIGVLAIVPPVIATDGEVITVKLPVDPLTVVFVIAPPDSATLHDVKFVTVPLVADKLAKPVADPPVT